ncbi:MAG TPA: Ig-like domain-containing protein, partial [Thermoanaerobaculia bacterium]|nr:Ig-like domain-containing protein [Thermoanaerobaculia bacterium]
PYRSDSFDASLFNAAQANAFFGDGRAVFYGLQGFIWTAELAGGDNPRYMPLDENDPIGYLDSINGNGVAFGWTCDRDDVRPISMELRESAPTPTGTLYGAVRTTVASEYAVLVQCHDANGFWPHRFSFQLPPETSGHMIDVWAKDYTYYGDVKLPCSAGGTGCYTWHDTTPPVTAIISPSEGAILTGITMAVASASDNVGVILKVEFYLDGVLGRTDTDRHIWNIDTTTVANGVHTLTSKAYDLAGNVGASNPVTFTVDNQSPTTAIPAPTAGATVAGTTTVTATASDNSGVTRVEFYLDGALANTDTVSPYAWSWDTTLAVNTTYTLVSKAYDAAGNIGTSATISVTVNNVDTTAPTTAITAPTNGTSVAGTTTVTATASDNNTVARVEFYLDGALIATDTSAPYSFSWNTTSASNGSHALVSKAYDAAANAGSSTTTTVTVSNGTSDTQPPTTGITSPAYGATVSGGPTVTASASDNVGVSRVEFYLDSVLQASVTSPPYSWVWYTTSSSNGGHTLTSKAYDAAGNIGTSAATVVTIGNYPLPTASFTVNGSGTTATISSGGRVTLYWSTTNANTLTLSPTGGTTSPLARQQTGGFLTYPIYVTTTYTLTVNGNGGTITKTVRVTVQ